MKKLTVAILLISIFLNLIQPVTVRATDSEKSNYQGLMEDGTSNITAGKENPKKRAEKLEYTTTGSAIGANAISLIGNSIAFCITSVISSVITNFNVTQAYMFTIYDAVFNNVELFDSNYLLDNGNTNNIHKLIKQSVAEWYYTIRNVAVILSLCMLIYVGIRMAISTIAEDKAKYKNMLIGWLQSFILIFFLHYIILFSMVISDTLLKLIKAMGITKKAELSILTNGFLGVFVKNGWDSVPGALVYWVMVFYQVKFFLLYMKRMLSVAFLIIISPLITVTYSIDKIGDGKAQAFSAWLKEFEVNMLIQPLHALLYTIFIVSAGEIATKAPILAAIFFMALSRGEKIIKGIFNARGMKSINSMGKSKKGK